MIWRSSQKGMVQYCRKGINSVLAYVCSDSGKSGEKNSTPPPQKKKNLSCDLIHTSNNTNQII
jgi:hypothetical protein